MVEQFEGYLKMVDTLKDMIAHEKQCIKELQEENKLMEKIRKACEGTCKTKTDVKYEYDQGT